MSGLPQLVVALVALQRVAEIAHSRRNERRLLAAGGREVGGRHYPLFIVLHGGWLASLFVFTPPDAAVHWPLLALFVVLQVGRIWVIATLGRYWTTRIITLSGTPLVRRGPYRLVRHPNYWIVTLEIAVLPLAFGQWQIALVFTALNLALLRHRVRMEEAALADRRSL